MLGKLPPLCAALLLASTPASAAIRVAVSYTFVEVEISPRQQVHRTNYTNYYTLEGHNVRFQSSLGNANAGSLGRSHVATSITGDRYDTSLKVEPGNRLVSVSNYPSQLVRTTITTNGVDSCRAVREAILKPGHQYFEETRISDHEHMILSDIIFENVRCEIYTP